MYFLNYINSNEFACNMLTRLFIAVFGKLRKSNRLIIRLCLMAIPPTYVRILFTDYDIITYFFFNLTSCSEHFISIKHRILTTFNVNKKKINSDRLYAFNISRNLVENGSVMLCILYILQVNCISIKFGENVTYDTHLYVKQLLAKYSVSWKISNFTCQWNI